MEHIYINGRHSAIARYNYNEEYRFLLLKTNYQEDKYKWDIGYDGDVGPFFMPLHMRKSLVMTEKIL